MEDVRISRMQLSDLDEVMEIEKVCYPTPWSRRAFVGELTENVYAHYIVAQAGDELIGYAGMWVILEEAHVTNVSVHPKHRRMGLGKRLLYELIERARNLGAARMTLEVRPSNHVARTLYSQTGFVECGRRKGYYTDTQEDAIIMWKYDLNDLSPVLDSPHL